MNRVLACIFLSVFFSGQIREAMGQPTDGGTLDPLPAASDVIKPVPARISHALKIQGSNGSAISYDYTVDFPIVPFHYPWLYSISDDNNILYDANFNYSHAATIPDCNFAPPEAGTGSTQISFRRSMIGPNLFPPAPPAIAFQVEKMDAPVVVQLKCFDLAPVPYELIRGIMMSSQIELVDKRQHVNQTGPGVTDVADLRIACSMQAPGGAFSIFTVSKEDGVNIDHSKSKAEIRALAQQAQIPEWNEAHALTLVDSSGVLTAPSGNGAAAEFGAGTCFWMTKMDVRVPKPTIFIPTEYPVNDCEYQAALPHEVQHFETMVDILRHYVEVMNDPSQPVPPVPTPNEPTYSDRTLSQDNLILLTRVVAQAWRNRYWEIVKSVITESVKDYDQVDRQATLAKCSNWGP